MTNEKINDGMDKVTEGLTLLDEAADEIEDEEIAELINEAVQTSAVEMAQLGLVILFTSLGDTFTQGSNDGVEETDRGTQGGSRGTANTTCSADIDELLSEGEEE